MSITRPNYVYAAKLERVVDGDTYELMVDLGCSTWVKITVRLLGVNCPEVHGETREAGLAATEEARRWFAEHPDLVIETRKEPKKRVDAFRRYLALIYGMNGPEGEQSSLSEQLLSTHNAGLFRPA